ncbi:MAG: hypothetical protein IPJ71_18230 [Bdellovibrionales bacterium]|nr:hypothetical protein [Bdellovibrionales bacterium]
MKKFVLHSCTAVFCLVNGLVQTGSAEMADGMLRALVDTNVYVPVYLLPSRTGAGFNSYFVIGHIGYESLFAGHGSSSPESRIYFGPSLMGLLHLSIGHPVAKTEGRSYRIRIGDGIPIWEFNRELKDSFLRTLSISLIGEYFERYDLYELKFGISIGISLIEISEFHREKRDRLQ